MVAGGMAVGLAMAQNQPAGAARGQGPKSPPVATQLISNRGPHWQTVQDLIPYRDDQGNWQYQTNTYVHLEPGLNYRTGQGQWTPAVEEFELLPQGAVARHGQHQVTLPGNLNGSQPVTLVQPDGQVVTSRPYGLAYYDSASGQAVLIAALKDCQGFQVATNQILYPDAFTNILADVRYTYTKGGFEQDIVLHQSPPAPEKFGLSSATARLEVWSEFLQAPAPHQATQLLNPQEVGHGRAAFTDEQLDFGGMRMGPGRAFQAGALDEDNVPVGKSWIQDQGRTFLIEAVELPAVQADLQTLPQIPGGGAIRAKPAKREVVLRGLPVRGREPQRQHAAIRPATKELLAALVGPALVLDYSTLNAGTLTANYVFKGDTTYYINGAVSTTQSTTAATTFEGGAVFKYNSGVSAQLTVNTPVVWQGSLYRPVVFTAKDDNTAGEPITGSTGSPSGTYATTALYLDGSATGANTSFNLAHLRISYAQTGLTVNQQTAHTFKHLQFVSCATAFNANSATIYVGNALFYSVATCFSGTSATASVEQVTADNVTTFCGGGLGGSGPTVQNSLLSLVTTPGTFVNNGGSVQTVTGNPFQTARGGFHYLAAGSPYRNVGLPPLNSGLAADLTRLTTYAPIELTAGFTASTTLAPQAQRDTDTPDLGYHYPPLDYIWSNQTLNSGVTLTLTNGVAVGVWGTTGLTVNGSLVSQGLPNALNRLTILNTVQEYLPGVITSTANFTLLGGSSSVSLRFTDVSFPAAATGGRALFGYNLYYQNSIKDCQFRGVYWSFLGNSGSALSLSVMNSVWERSTVQWYQGYNGVPEYLSLTVQNNLFNRSSVSLTHYSQSYGSWSLFDNVFDNATVTLTEDGVYPYSGGAVLGSSEMGYNACINTTSPLGGSGNITGLTEDFVAGPLGNYYRPTSGGTGSTAGLNDADPTSGRTPAARGLYHYTTRSDLAKEAATALDLGFHYVATDANGNPLDSDGDGIPDYLEDANGNGTADSGETNWNQFDAANATATGAFDVFTVLK